MMFLTSLDRPWAITPRAIRAMVRAIDHPDFAAAYEAMTAKASPVIRGVSPRGSTAVLDIRGPLLPYRSIWTWLLGGTAVEDVSAGLTAALDDPAVKQIVLAINSPGGQIDGINELANKIRAVNAQKPVTAYVAGLGASGAYWLASAAGRIVADETAQLGSIGVLATVVDDSALDEKHGIKRFNIVSSQSPLKRTDPATDEGRAQLQEMVDALANIFIGAVAKFRGTDAKTVQADFGRGAVLPAGAAVTVGMADALGSLDGILRGEGTADAQVGDIRDKPGLRVAAAMMPIDDGDDEEDDDDEDDVKDVSADDPENGDDEDDKEAEVMSTTEERQRIAAILNLEEAKGREELARTLALDIENTFSVDAAKKILAAAPVATKKENALDERMKAIANPKVGVPGDDKNDDSPAAEARRVLAFVPQNRLRPHARVQ